MLSADELVKNLLLRHSRLRGNDGITKISSFYDAITVNAQHPTPNT